MNTLQTPVQLAGESQEHADWHASINVVVHDPIDNLYLLRHADQSSSDAEVLWDTTANGGVDDGEPYYDAAQRRLLEQTGVRGLSLDEYMRTESEQRDGGELLRNRIVTYLARRAMKFVRTRHVPNSVSGMLWVPQQQLFDMAAVEPPIFTDGLKAFTEHVAADKKRVDDAVDANARLRNS